METQKVDLATVATNINPFELVKGKGLSQILEIYFQINHLKQLFRRGWLRRDRVSREHCERVAEHCFMMIILAWTIMEQHALNLDMLKVFKMIIAHEFGEVYAGDMNQTDGISDQEKYCREKASVEKIFKAYPWGEPFIAAWEEYAAKETDEAKFVGQIDKLEMACQGAVYQLQFTEQDFSSFMQSAGEKIYDTELIKLFKELRSL